MAQIKVYKEDKNWLWGRPPQAKLLKGCNAPNPPSGMNSENIINT
jgi:hypothetical protein